MKEIKAIVRPFMLEHILDALESIEGWPGGTRSKVLGWGKSRAAGVAAPVRAAGHAFAPKSQLEVVVPDEMVEAVLSAIEGAARTGKPGDGKVFVIDALDALKIRTGERGDAAI
jgi:nitrogen regulatory protein PII